MMVMGINLRFQSPVTWQWVSTYIALHYIVASHSVFNSSIPLVCIIRCLLHTHSFLFLCIDLSQFFALLISVFASADVVDSLESVLIKYDGTILRDFPAASKTKWILSNVGRFVEGVLGIAVAWVFIIQSTDVLGLFLDFTAVQFVSELDNVGYYIANKGFIIGGNVQSLTESMLNVRMSQAEKLDDNGDILRKKLRVRRLFKHLVFRGTIFILISTWTYVKILQFGG